jgi:hypothetical protein
LPENKDKLENAKAEISAQGGRAYAFSADVSSMDASPKHLRKLLRW